MVSPRDQINLCRLGYKVWSQLLPRGRVVAGRMRGKGLDPAQAHENVLNIGGPRRCVRRQGRVKLQGDVTSLLRRGTAAAGARSDAHAGIGHTVDAEVFASDKRKARKQYSGKA